MKNKIVFFAFMLIICGIFAESFYLIGANHCAEKGGVYENFKCDF
jgi:hypothetical protein